MPQTKEQFWKKYRELRINLNNLMAQHAEHLLASGGIDPTAYEDDYRLPKIIFHACLGHAREQFTPHNPTDKRTSLNLDNF